jgi:hypothetical protein
MENNNFKVDKIGMDKMDNKIEIEKKINRKVEKNRIN